MLAFLKSEFKILAYFKISAFQNLEIKILAYQNPEFKIFCRLQDFNFPKSYIQDFGRLQDFSFPKS